MEDPENDSFTSNPGKVMELWASQAALGGSLQQVDRADPCPLLSTWKTVSSSWIPYTRQL